MGRRPGRWRGGRQGGREADAGRRQQGQAEAGAARGQRGRVATHGRGATASERVRVRSTATAMTGKEGEARGVLTATASERVRVEERRRKLTREAQGSCQWARGGGRRRGGVRVAGDECGEATGSVARRRSPQAVVVGDGAPGRLRDRGGERWGAPDPERAREGRGVAPAWAMGDDGGGRRQARRRVVDAPICSGSGGRKSQREWGEWIGLGFLVARGRPYRPAGRAGPIGPTRRPGGPKSSGGILFFFLFCFVFCYFYLFISFLTLFILKYLGSL